MDEFVLRISFSGLVFGFVFPEKISVPEEFQPLLYEGDKKTDEEYRIILCDSLPYPENHIPVFSTDEMRIYENEKGHLRVYGDGKSNFCACFIGNSGKNELYFLRESWNFYSSPFRVLHLIAGEKVLLRHSSFLLHSSVVTINNSSVLFCGESGAGKSTQAALWEKYLSAEIINGDRCLVTKKDNCFYGGGSPWCGTSGIRKSSSFPVAGIFIVEKSSYNEAVLLNSGAFLSLYKNCTVNTWDKSFVYNLTELLSQLVSSVPVYKLYCRMDEEATKTAYKALFGEKKRYES